jgi:hypothetical protein
MTATYSAVQLSVDSLMTDHLRVYPVPPGTLDAGVGVVLAKLGERFANEGVVLLDESAARAMRLPTTSADIEAADGEHPELREARGAGWSVKKLGDWTTFRREGLMLRVGILPALKSKSFALQDPADDMSTLTSCALWQKVTGSAYHGNVGMAGTAILTRVTSVGKKHLQPTWKPKIELVPGFEDDFQTDHFRAPASGMAFAHALDANRSYISSFANAVMAPWQLKQGGRTFDKRKGGWWLCELSPWQDARMPDPAGYAPTKGPRWITTPTVALLMELAEEGVYGGVTILDSRIGDGSELLRPFCHVLRDAYAAVDGQALDQSDADRVRTAIKNAGRQTLGLLASETNFIYRPDWWHAGIAMDRSNRWRKMWKTGKTQNRWPLWIDVDNVWYASDEEDPIKAAPEGWEIDNTGMKLGHYKTKATRKSRVK